MDLQTIDLLRQTLILTLKIAAPIRLAGIIIGLLISLIQSITSIQDQTLTFVPKIFGMVLVAILLIPWIVRWLVEFTRAMFALY